MIYVKTVYDFKSLRNPNISEYKNKKDAETFVRTCLKWGLGIVSCSIISEEQALKEIKSGNVEYEDCRMEE